MHWSREIYCAPTASPGSCGEEKFHKNCGKNLSFATKEVFSHEKNYNEPPGVPEPPCHVRLAARKQKIKSRENVPPQVRPVCAGLLSSAPGPSSTRLEAAAAPALPPPTPVTHTREKEQLKHSCFDTKNRNSGHPAQIQMCVKTISVQCRLCRMTNCRKNRLGEKPQAVSMKDLRNAHGA